VRHRHDFGAVLHEDDLRLVKEFSVPLGAGNDRPRVERAWTPVSCCTEFTAEVCGAGTENDPYVLHAVLVAKARAAGRFGWSGRAELHGVEPAEHHFNVAAAIYPRVALENNPVDGMSLRRGSRQLVQAAIVVRTTAPAAPQLTVSVSNPALRLKQRALEQQSSEPFHTWRMPVELEVLAGEEPGTFAAELRCETSAQPAPLLQALTWKVEPDVAVTPTALLFEGDQTDAEQLVTVTGTDAQPVRLVNAAVPVGYTYRLDSSAEANRIVVALRRSSAQAKSIERATIQTTLGTAEVVLYAAKPSGPGAER
jgi:hypothetical protein